MFIRTTFILIISFSTSIVGRSQTELGSSKKFEGIVYSRATFPGHPLYNTLKALDFENGDFTKQTEAINDLKKYQRSLKQENEQQIKDAFFISGMMVLPQYSRMYVTPSGSLVATNALGYKQETFIKSAQGSMFLTDRDNTNQVTVNFPTSNLLEVWQKYQVGASQYSVQKTNEMTTIAGFKCRKNIYTFNGTYGGIPVGNYIINLQPQKVTVWYTEELPAAINVIHPLYFELDKAILRFEVEYDKNSKNKMLVEITGLTPQKIDEKDLERTEMPPVLEYKKGDQQGQMMIMQIMMNAISQLTKE